MTIPDGFAQVNFVFGGTGAPTGAEVTFGLDISGAGLTVQEVADAMSLNFQSNVMPPLTDDLALVETRVKFGPEDTGASASTFSLIPGGDSGATTSPGVAYLVKKTTLSGGRAGRGRCFLPGVAEAAVNEAGAVDSAKRLSVEAAMQEFLDQTVLDEMFLVVLHSPGSPITSPSSIQSLPVDAKVATQRRRLRR